MYRHRRGEGEYRDVSSNSPDLLYEQYRRQQKTVLGSPPYNANVVATFDSRFINGQDFVNTNYETWNITGNPPTSLTLDSDFVVPAGFIAVVRGYSYEMDPPVPIEPDDLLLDWRVDQVSVRGHVSLMHGQISGLISTFFLAPSAATIRASFRAPSGIASNVGDTRKILIQLRGNLIQDTGVDLAEEIANPDYIGGVGVKGKGRDRI